MKRSRENKFRLKMPPMLIVLLGFLLVMLTGAFLMALPISNTDGKWMRFTDAVFWATNGVCGTGLVLKPPALGLTAFGQAILFILVQFGGLGFMTFATFIFILIGKKITLKDRIAIQESLGADEMKGVVRLVRNIAIMTVVIEAAGAILLTPFFCVRNGAIGIWQAVFNSVSAFCNAGFDVNGRIGNEFGSLTDYNGNFGVLAIVSVLSILGAFGFPVLNDIVKCKFRIRKYQLHTKIVLIVQLSIMLFGTFFYLASEFNSAATVGMNGGRKLLNSMFQAIMASSTAGFSSLSQNDMSSAGKLFSCIVMFIGASPCSTGGGIKTSTFALLVLMMIAGVRGKEEVVIGRRNIGYKTGLRAVAVVSMAMAGVAIGIAIMSATDPGIATTTDLYECITAFTTTGLSMGVAPIYSPAALYVLIVLMIVGRLGPLSIGMIFVRRDNTSIKYPNGNIMIG